MVVLLPGELLAERLDVGQELADGIRKRELRLGFVDATPVFAGLQLQSLPLLRFEGIRRCVSGCFTEPSS